MIDLNNTDIEGASGDIIDNIKTIFTTPQGTVPFDRNFGMDISILDEPMNLAQTKLTVEFIRKVQLYEPRVKVREVTFILDENNNYVPKVRIE